MNKNEVFAQIKTVSKFANKEIGQNFLINQNIASNIVKLLDINEKDDILEIGAGFAALSIFLLDYKYRTLTLNDIDVRAIEFLESLVENRHHTYIINKSSLKLDINNYSKIIGNLPYYITNDLLERCFTKSCAKKYVFMIQKEVFDRLVAKENTSNYGPLAILLNYLGEVKQEFLVDKNNFLPSPHIDSLVFSVNVKCDNSIDKYKFLQFLKRMFIHRRKTIYNNLSLYLMNKDKAKKILEELNISILNRPEQISSEKYIQIFAKTKG